MPSSEQEMRDRARKWLAREFGWKLSPDAEIVVSLADFALLERADARREQDDSLYKIRQLCSSLYYGKGEKEYIGRLAEIRGIVDKLLRAKLTPAPEAEKGQKNG